MIGRGVVVACVLVSTTIARADAPLEVDAPTAELGYLLRTARTEATADHCDTVVMLGARVQRLDAAFFAGTFATDAAIASCTPVPGQPGQAERESPGGAAALSITGSLAGVAGGIALIVSAADDRGFGRLASGTLAGAVLAFGPSLGRTYVGGTWNWWLGVRLIGLGVIAGGAAIDAAGWTGRAVDGPGAGLFFGVLGGGILYTIGMLGDNVATPLTAIDHNAKRDQRRLAVVPLRTRDGASGLALVGSF